MTFTDTPPAGVSILSFTIVVSGVSLTPATGSAVNLITSSAPVTVELTRLQSDTYFAGTFTNIPTGVYNNVIVALGSPTIVFANSSGATIGTCPNNSICTIQPTYAATVTLTPGSAVLTLTTATLGLAWRVNRWA